MKKLLLLIATVLLSTVLFLIFNDKGNEYLKPYLANYLKKQLDNNMSVTIKHLKIDQNYIEIVALLDQKTKIDARGPILFLKQHLELKYNIDNPIYGVDINGSINGEFDNMNIVGRGDALTSKILYSFNLKEDRLNQIKVKIKKADIQQLLALSGEPKYADGLVDINIDIPTFDEDNTKGVAHILLHKTKLNKEAIKKSFQIEIPQNSSIYGEILADVTKEKIDFNSDIKSNLLKIKLTDANYKLKDGSFTSHFYLQTKELSKLSSLTNQKLYGELEAKGDIEFKNNLFSLKALTHSFKGETKVLLKGETLLITLQKNRIEKLLTLLGKPTYAVGNLSGEIELSNLKELTGQFNIETQEAIAQHKVIQKELNVDLGSSTPFNLTTKGDILSNQVKMEMLLDSELFNLKSSNIVYNIENTKLHANYLLLMPNLSKLKPLVGKALQGKSQIAGEVQYAQTLLLTGKTDNLDGEINFTLEDNRLHTVIKRISVEKLMQMLRYPQIFRATLDGEFNYNLVDKKGTFDSKLNQAKLLPNMLTELIKQLRGVDLTKERYNETTFNAKLNKERINFDFIAKSKTVKITIHNAEVNKENNTINAPYRVAIKNKDIKGTIKGNISQPHINIDSSELIKDTVIDAIESQIGKGKIDDKIKELGKDLGIGKEESETIKNILGDLFK